MTENFLVIGCGSMGRRRIRHAQKHRAATVYGFDIREDRVREVEEQLSVTPVESIDALDMSNFSGLFICVPPGSHEDYINIAISNGTPFMVEQPITHVLNNIKTLYSRVKDNGIICHVSCNQRFSPRVQAIKRVLNDGRIGKVLTGIVDLGEWLPDWHPYEPYTDYYPSKISMGGGLDSICDIDWLRYLFGDIQRAKHMSSKKSDLKIDTYDIVQQIFDFKDGPQIVLHTDMLQRPFMRRSLFSCSNGAIIHNHPEHKLKVYIASDDKWFEEPFQGNLSADSPMQGKPQHGFAEPMYEADSTAFFTRIDQVDKSLDSLENGLENLKICWPLVFGEDE